MRAMPIIRVLRPTTAGRLPASRVCSSASRRPLQQPLSRRSLTTSGPASTSAHTQQQPSFMRRATNFIAMGIVFTSLGFTIAAAPALEATKSIINPPTAEDTLTMFKATDEQAIEVEDYINNHALAKEIRSKPGFTEMRPHLKVPPAYRRNSLTGGVLTGPGRLVVPPYAWIEEGGRSLVSISHLGDQLCGHPSIVHGGFVATMMDEGMARCCFGALPHNIALTATLNINYRRPVPANSYVVLRATTTRVEGRKAWVEGRLETLVGEGETPVVLAEATGLFVSPKHAAAMKNVFPAT